MCDDRPKAIAWTGHNEGQQTMFLARGPKAFQSDPSHSLFTDARVNMVCPLNTELLCYTAIFNY